MKVVCDCGNEMVAPVLSGHDPGDGSYGEDMHIEPELDDFKVIVFQNSIAIECKKCRKDMFIFTLD